MHPITLANPSQSNVNNGTKNESHRKDTVLRILKIIGIIFGCILGGAVLFVASPYLQKRPGLGYNWVGITLEETIVHAVLGSIAGLVIGVWLAVKFYRNEDMP
ncbi:MAG: hypothetical protein LLG04_11495 [Parachlamydia sp.]|nr:hypothetical protein [Parachlamydia sp.]